MLVTAAKNRSWLVTAIPNKKYFMKYHPACNIYSDTNGNRRPTWMLLEGGGGERGKMTKTNSKKQNHKSQLETTSLKLITIIVH